MKRLQHELGVRMAVYGRGSMRDKSKEEELRKEGGKKYGHLNDDLHVFMEINAPADQAYEMMGRAIATIKPYFDPTFEDGNMPPQAEGHADPYGNGIGRGRGGGRGRGAAPLLPSSGAMRGGRAPAPPAPRGAPRGRAAPPARPAVERGYGDADYYHGSSAAAAAPAYSAYEAEASYEDSYRAPARDPYAASSRQAASEVQSFDYGHGSSSDAYDAPAQDTWERRDPYQSRAPAPRGGRGAAEHRSHPYERQAARHAAPRY